VNVITGKTTGTQTRR